MVGNNRNLRNNNHFLKDNISKNRDLTPNEETFAYCNLYPKVSDSSMGNGRGVMDQYFDDKLDVLNCTCCRDKNHRLGN